MNTALPISPFFNVLEYSTPISRSPMPVVGERQSTYLREKVHNRWLELEDLLDRLRKATYNHRQDSWAKGGFVDSPKVLHLSLSLYQGEK